MRPPAAITDDTAHFWKAPAHRVGIARQHRLHSVADDLGQISVVDSRSAEVSDVAVAALVGADVEAGGFLGRLPKVAIEGSLAP